MLNKPPKVVLTEDQWLCLQCLRYMFKAEHLKEKTVRETSVFLEFWFTRKVVDETLELSRRAIHGEITLAKKLR